MPRPAAVSGAFYPAAPEACRRAVEECFADLPAEETFSEPAVGGLVPHAGWVYSGPTAARTIRACADPPPRCFVLFGAVHQPGVRRATVSPDTFWDTPLGEVPVDRDLAGNLLDAVPDLLEEASGPHRSEHSIEVQIPLLRHLSPNSTILPIVVPPTPDAAALGERVGEALGALEGRFAVLGSTDLTHYGPRFYGFTPAGRGAEAHRWSKEVNDRGFLERVLDFDAAGALSESQANRSACGGGAAAACVAAARALGARTARLLEHTTSFEVRPDPSGPTDFVGYASVVFFA